MITSKIITNGILKAIGFLVIVSLFLYFLYQIQSVLIYLLVAFVLTLIGNPILDFFKRRLKFNHIFATIATLLIFILLIAGFIMMFIPLILSQGENLSLLNTTEIEKNTLQLINQIAMTISHCFFTYYRLSSLFTLTICWGWIGQCSYRN